MLQKKIVTSVVAMLALNTAAFAKDYTNTSYYVAYDAADTTQYALVMPSVHKVYTHKAGKIQTSDLSDVTDELASFPTYNNGQLCFGALKSGAAGVHGASTMAQHCYDVNFFYTQKESMANGTAFMLYYKPAQRVYEGLAGQPTSFKVVKEGSAAKNANSLTHDNYTLFDFQLDKAIATVGKTIRSLTFAPLNIAANDTEKQEMRVSSKLTVTYNDSTTQEFPLSYKTMMKMGDVIGSGKIGLMTDEDGNALKKSDGSEDISDGPDGNSLISVGGKNYLITHMEERPGSLYKTELQLQNNELKPVQTAPVDLKSVGGTIINCASTKTAYGSHLGGEEDYSLNTRYADKNSPFYVDCALDGSSTDVSGEFNYFCNYVDQMAKYLKDTNIDKTNGYNGDKFSPYNYGYILEVQPQADGTTKAAKHYVTGKYTPELAAMMPDGKTVYMSDDGTAKGLWKFVSDTKITDFKENWEGTLYAAKVTQKSADNGGNFDLSWVELGHAKDSEIKSMIDSKMKLTDIFAIENPDENGTCNAGFTKVFEDSKFECLNLKAGKDKAAAFLETRKYAAYKGATIEFRKEEGLTYDADKNVLYVAMSAVEKSMEDNYKGEEPANDIRLPKNACGAVYAMTLDENYSGTKFEAIVTGKPLSETDQYANEWYCDPNGISNPDNITYIGHNTLLISEDTTKHVNNMTWAYNTQTKAMTRIASLPIGAEVTGVDKGNVDVKSVIMLNAQHPFKDNPKAADGTKPNSSLIENATDEQLKAIVGYIDGLPSDLFE